MYELDPEWEAYYQETDPKKRAKIAEEHRDSQTAAARAAIYEKRYKRNADTFLRCLVELQVLAGSFTSGRGAVREIRKELSLLTLDGKTEYQEEERAILYWEIRNTALRYLESTKSDDYARKYCGLVRSTEAEKKQRAAEDIWKMTEGIRKKVPAGRDAKLDADLALYISAVQDAYRESDPEARQHFRDAGEKQS
ncbi:MAG: hypothetical protein PUE63_07905 [Lachnospiraceae bacterium]|nr:hypothetical protein [Lachnospiraceae bacterium]